MEFFGIGGWEILVIAILAMVIIGPKQLILLARKAGQTLAYWQAQWVAAWSVVNDELTKLESETGEPLSETINTIGDMQRILTRGSAEIGKEVTRAITAPTDPPASAGESATTQPPSTDQLDPPPPTEPPKPPTPAPTYSAWVGTKPGKSN